MLAYTGWLLYQVSALVCDDWIGCHLSPHLTLALTWYDMAYFGGTAQHVQCVEEDWGECGVLQSEGPATSGAEA